GLRLPAAESALLDLRRPDPDEYDRRQEPLLVSGVPGRLSRGLPALDRETGSEFPETKKRACGLHSADHRLSAAEDRGFEPLRALTQPAFQASAIGH